MMFQSIQYAIQDRIATITLHRPEKRNALNDVMIRELFDANIDAENNEDVRVIVLQGSGGNFCAGADLQYLLQLQKNSVLENADDSRRLMQTLYRWKTCAKPTIALVEGNALAGGCGLALTCDIIIASENAKFGFTEVRIGFVPAIVSRLLIDRIGKGSATELLLRGNILTAQDARGLSMINHVVASEDVQRHVYTIAREIAQQTSPESVRLTKQLLREIESLDLREAMNHAVAFNAFSRTTPDFQKGVESFVKKEKIDWTK